MRPRYMEPLHEGSKIESASFTNSQVVGGKEKIVCSHKQLEIPKSPAPAMEYLCRSWSPSASDFLQIFPSNNLWMPCDPKKQDDESLKSAHGTPTGSIQQGMVEMEVNHNSKTWLRVDTWNRLFRSRKEKKKEDARLHTAQLHAALSLTQLAAAITGISHSLTPNSPNANGRGEAPHQDMSNVVSSAAALVTTVCAEAAESLGARKAQVRAAVNSGMAIQTPIDMIAVTATAATCLRGAAILKSRAFADPLARIQEMLKIGSQICIIMPSGRKESTKVSVYLKDDHLLFSFSKKYFGGALTSSKEYKVSSITEEKLEHQGCSFLCLKTKKGTIKLLFEGEMQTKIWISTIFNLLELRNPSYQASPTHYCFRSFNM